MQYRKKKNRTDEGICLYFHLTISICGLLSVFSELWSRLHRRQVAYEGDFCKFSLFYIVLIYTYVIFLRYTFFLRMIFCISGRLLAGVIFSCTTQFDSASTASREFPFGLVL